ncbi:MAG TPA: ChaB family protein [Gaiellaceae bacterium]|jgi:cation transport regulator ChaB|nr:ChaB family protein [Gaiellaceae bacterium]
MPKTTREGKPKQSELPETLRRSGSKAQRTFAKVHDAAAEQYGEGERAHRTAYAALKHTHEKVGDHWEPKDEPGPSDPRSKLPTKAKARGEGETYGGVDAEGNTKRELYERARALGVEGRSRMSKRELARAIAKRQ